MPKQARYSFCLAWMAASSKALDPIRDHFLIRTPQICEETACVGLLGAIHDWMKVRDGILLCRPSRNSRECLDLVFSHSWAASCS